jgi:hypothetical protein
VRTPAHGAERLLVRQHPTDEPKTNLTSFQAPVFSPDGQRVYFLSEAWATSLAVHVVDVRTAKEHFVIDGSDLQVAASGTHRGDLLVGRHMYIGDAANLHAEDQVWLVSPEGQPLRALAEGVDIDKLP